MVVNFVPLGRPAFDEVATKRGFWDSTELLFLAEEFTRLGREAQGSNYLERTERLKSRMGEILGKMIQRTNTIQRYQIENARLVFKREVEEYPKLIQDVARRIGKPDDPTTELLMRFGLGKEHLGFVTGLLSQPPVEFIKKIEGNPFRALGDFSSHLGILVEVLPKEDIAKSNPVDWRVISVSLGMTTAGLVIVFLAGALDTSLSSTAQTLGTGLVASGTAVLGTSLAAHKK